MLGIEGASVVLVWRAVSAYALSVSFVTVEVANVVTIGLYSAPTVLAVRPRKIDGI